MAALNQFDYRTGGNPTGSAGFAEAVTPSNSVDLTYVTRGLYVGGGGDVTCVMQAGGTVTFSAVPTGTLLPIRISRVNSTSTTATLMIAVS